MRCQGDAREIAHLKRDEDRVQPGTTRLIRLASVAMEGLVRRARLRDNGGELPQHGIRAERAAQHRAEHAERVPHRVTNSRVELQLSLKPQSGSSAMV